jgi:hypothetical protein
LSAIDLFSDEQARSLLSLQQHYQVWIEAERALAALPYDLRRKEVDGRAYLYEIVDRGGNGKSLGAWSAQIEARFTAYREEKGRVKARIQTSRLLDGQVLVVGTNAMPAYAVEAGGFIREAPDETQDFDLAWAAISPDPGAPTLWPLLKAVDPTFTVNMERGFQARNAKAYEVEVVVAPSRAATLHRLDQPHPLALPEQEWLLKGRPVDHVVISRGGAPARIVAPDPRWFALQKLWMARQPKRSALKRPKDRKQGLALLNAVDAAMPQYSLDEVFEAALPEALVEPYREWKAQRLEKATQRW